MWRIDADLDLGALTPAEQLWVIALACEENGAPAAYYLALRKLAEHLEELGWWLREPARGVRLGPT